MFLLGRSATGIEQVLFISFCLLLTLIDFKVNAQEAIWLFDLDGPTLENREYAFSHITDDRILRGGSFQTPFTLVRIRDHGLPAIGAHLYAEIQRMKQENPNFIDSDLLDVPARDFEVLVEAEYRQFFYDDRLSFKSQNKLASGEGMPGQLELFRLSNGLEFYPGRYRIDPSITYRYFAPSPGGEVNYLLETLKRALKEPKGRRRLKGSLWPLFESLMVSERGARRTGILTARPNEIDEFVALFNEMRRERLIKNIPNQELIFGATHPNFDRLTRSQAVQDRKFAIVKEILINLMRTRFRESQGRVERAHSVAHPDNPDQRSSGFHVLVLPEDSDWILKKYYKELSFMMSSGLYPVKIILVNGALKEDRLRSAYPDVSVVTTKGLIRPGRLSELLEVMPSNSRSHFKQKFEANICASLTFPAEGPNGN